MGYSWGAEGTGRAPDEHSGLREATRFIAAQPSGPQRLLARHLPDEQGRCRGCTVPGYGTPDKPWPCVITKMAQAAAAPHNID